MPQLTQVNALAGLEAFNAGREQRTNRQVSNALAGNDLNAARQAAFQGGQVNTGLSIQQYQDRVRQRTQAMNQQERERLRQNVVDTDRFLVELGSLDQAQALAAFDNVAPLMVQRGIMDQGQVAQYRALIEDPNYQANIRGLRGIIAEDLPEFMQPTTLSNNEVMIDPLRSGQVENVTSVRAQQEDQRSNRAGEALGRFTAETGRMNAQTSRMGEQRQAAAQSQDGGQYERDQSRRIAEEFARQDQIFSTIDRAIEQVSPATAGVGSTFSFIPGSPQRNLSATLDTVRANIGFEELNRMRQLSPTGGALGQVTERELAFLQSVLGSLEQSQSPQQLRANLERVREQIQGSRERVAEAFRQDFGTYPPGYTPSAPVDAPPDDQAPRLRYNPDTDELE